MCIDAGGAYKDSNADSQTKITKISLPRSYLKAKKTGFLVLKGTDCVQNARIVRT